MQFRIRAFDEAGQRMLGLCLDARDEADARLQIAARGLTLLSVSAASAWNPGVRRERFDVALFTQELHTLTQAGLSVVESLEALLEKEDGVVPAAVLNRLLDALRQGHTLSAAMRQQGDDFPLLLIGIVQAAERTGDLPESLERYLAYHQRVHAVRQRVIAATIYPAILFAVGGGVALFLMAWVVPRFAAVYRGSGRALPWGSQLLLDWGQLMNEHALGILSMALLTTGGVVLAARAWLRRHGWQALLARVPGVGRWSASMGLARLYLTLGLLLRGGLPVQQALRLVRSVLPAGRQGSIDVVARLVAQGLPLSQAMSQAALTSPIALRFVRAGERSGQLAEMLTRAALYHDAESARWADRFSRVFEPVLMAVIGLVIGVIVLLLYMPVFDLAGSLQ